MSKSAIAPRVPVRGPKMPAGARLDPSSFVPLYHQLKELLKASIVAGVWKADEMIPSENELAATHDVAVGTVKKALSELVREGFVVRRQGKGTFVVRPDFGRSFFRFFRFDLDQASEEVVPVSQVLSAGPCLPPPRAREVLRLAKGERVIHLERLRSFNELPFMYEDLYLPEKLFAGLDQMDLSRQLLYPIYDRKYNAPIVWADEFLEPRLATPEIATHLGIASGAPVIFLERIAYSFEDRPVEFRASYGRGDRFRYHIELR